MSAPNPPRAERRPGGDPYAWLRDADWQRVMREPAALDADIRAYLEAENAYTDAMLAPTEALQAALYDELKGRIKDDESSVPAADGPYLYFHRYAPGGQHPIWCRTTGDQGEQMLLDGDGEAEGEAFFRVGGARHSPDHTRFAYAVDVAGGEYYTIKIRNVANGRLLDEAVTNVESGFVWANDSATLYYVALDDNHRPCRIYRHLVGDPADRDELIYEEDDSGFFLGLDKTMSGRFILIEAHDHADTTEVRTLDADDPAAATVLISARRKGLSYEVSDWRDQFFILTNQDAEDFRIAAAPIAAPGRDNWRPVIDHLPGRLILRMAIFAGHLVRLERQDGLPRIVIRRLDDGAEHDIAFDEAAYQLGMLPGFQFDTATLRFTYSSLAAPQRTYDYDMETRSRTLRKEQEIPSGHDPDGYVVRRVFAEAADGAKVPVSVLHRRDTPLDGSAPLLLYGYGAYGHAIPAAFAPNRFSLVDRGFVYAIAHIRGGTDCGQAWYLDGKMMHKKNTFGDFIAAAEHLIEAGFTAAGNIVAHGGSAGGMLMGAVGNMRPDLFRAIIAEVPFVDVLNTMSDAALPLTPPEWEEWGNPIDDAAARAYMASYCPYTNVSAQPYPAILATGGLSDPRVTYWEPAKWVARLRELNTGAAPVLLRINMEAGHGGASGRYARLKEVAMTYAFALMMCGRV